MKGHRHLTIVIKLGALSSSDLNFLNPPAKTAKTAKTKQKTPKGQDISSLTSAAPRRHAGTSSIVDEKTHEPLLSILTSIVETAVKLHKDGHRVVLVSSGAIGVGLRRMDIEKRPKHLPRVQALAAVGQCRLMSLWDSLFGHLRQPVAQILLTRNDIADRTQYLNAQNTFHELLNMGVIPIVNENDTLAVTEIKFGDNDTLSAITAAMVQADYLFLMTDVDCLYTANPRTHPEASAIEVVEDIASLAADVSTAGSSLGTGGMSTKIVAARLATSAGVTTVITRSSSPGNIVNIVKYTQHLQTANKHPQQGQSQSQSQSQHPSQTASPSLPPTPGATSEDPLTRSISSLYLDSLPKPPLHTRFLPDPHPIRDRYFWLLHGLAPHGTVYIDEGAHRALADKAGLLPVGVVDVEGHFAQQEAVRLVVRKRHDHHHPAAVSSTASSTPTSTTPPVLHHGHGHDQNQPPNQGGEEIGRALVNYSSTEIQRIRGLKSTEIESVLGYADSEYVALRENISFFSHHEHYHRGGNGGVASARGTTTAGALKDGAGSGSASASGSGPVTPSLDSAAGRRESSGGITGSGVGVGVSVSETS
ncbi:MAG: hypothetical protein M1819_001329 [Sarea resinae]|nr:MAG: hypothetical protein M1819_001329 [Sarea resinae]